MVTRQYNVFVSVNTRNIRNSSLGVNTPKSYVGTVPRICQAWGLRRINSSRLAPSAIVSSRCVLATKPFDRINFVPQPFRNSNIFHFYIIYKIYTLHKLHILLFQVTIFSIFCIYCNLDDVEFHMLW